MNKVYEIITNRIISMLENGTIPWRQPWRSGIPMSITGRPYRGINMCLLGSTDFTSPCWLTWNQTQERKGHIKKGEKGMPVVFWKLLSKTKTHDENTGDNLEKEETIPYLRYYTVWNLNQIEGIDSPKAEVREFNPIGKCEDIVTNMPKRPNIWNDKSKAYYSPNKDFINMPKHELFESEEAYYSVLFHELTHSTGHPSRLARKGITDVKPFGSDLYSNEELIAEFGAAFLCAETSIENKTIETSASYIQNWLHQLKNDKRLVVIAASQAQKALDFILNRT